jgi:rod shape-determining protein MreD
MGGLAGAVGRVAGVAAMAAAAWFALSIELAPLGGGRATPDLLFCVVAFFAIRRPRGAPAALVLALGLARDLLGGGPVGAGALGLLASAEILRAQAPRLRRASLLLEAAHVLAAALVATALPWLLAVVTLADTPPVADMALRFGLTALAWPVTVLALRGLLRLRSEASPAEGDPMFGRRA